MRQLGWQYWSRLRGAKRRASPTPLIPEKKNTAQDFQVNKRAMRADVAQAQSRGTFATMHAQSVLSKMSEYGHI